MDATQLPKGKSKELTSDGRLMHQPGVYKHKDNGRIFITAEGESGVVQADALFNPLWESAWEWIAEVPSRLEILEMRKAQLLKDKKAEAAEKKAEETELKEATPEVELPVGGETYEPSVK